MNEDQARFVRRYIDNLDQLIEFVRKFVDSPDYELADEAQRLLSRTEALLKRAKADLKWAE